MVLTTSGGSLIPVQRIVDVLRHYYREVNFIIPDYAFSAGTIWCMSGDNIYMNYYSALGPIDPQVQNKDGKLVAALGYLDKINELLQKAQARTLTEAEFLILKDFDLAELRSYEQAKELAIDMLKEWLTKYKFKDWTVHSSTEQPVTKADKEQRAIEIAQKLSDNNRWKFHGRPIGIDTLTNELHLTIVDFGKEPELNQKISEYYDVIVRVYCQTWFSNFLSNEVVFMSVIEEIKNLKFPESNKSDSLKFLEDALSQYHQMINAGILKPRENQLQQTYSSISYQSNGL